MRARLGTLRLWPTVTSVRGLPATSAWTAVGALCALTQVSYAHAAGLASTAATAATMLAQAATNLAGSQTTAGSAAYADLTQRGAALFTTTTPTGAATPRLWPEADLDALSSTDFEDLAVFAADVLEFVQQDYALLVAAYGDSRLAIFGAGAVWAAARVAKAVASSRRLK